MVAGRLSRNWQPTQRRSGLNDIQLRQKAQEINLVADIRALDSIGSSGISFFVELYTSVTKAPTYVSSSPALRPVSPKYSK